MTSLIKRSANSPVQAINFYMFQLHIPGALAHAFIDPMVPETHFTNDVLQYFNSTFWIEPSRVGNGFWDFTPNKRKLQMKSSAVFKWSGILNSGSISPHLTDLMFYRLWVSIQLYELYIESHQYQENNMHQCSLNYGYSQKYVLKQFLIIKLFRYIQA